MSSYAFDWIDAFTNRAFGGNGCVVVHGAEDLPLQDRLALVRETSLSECAFLVGSDVADFGVRYYLADREILMAGHPTIATVVSLLERGLVVLQNGQADFTLEVGAGVLPIAITAQDAGYRITMTQPAPVFGAYFDPMEIAGLYGLQTSDLLAPPQVVSTGTPFCIVLLRDKDTQRRAVLNVAAVHDFIARHQPNNPGLLEPFLVTLGGETAMGDTFSRLLLAPPHRAEDPFTGSATGCMAAYLWHHGLIDMPEFVAEQGHWMGRPGQAHVEVLGPREAITGVRVGGSGVVLMQGALRL